VKVTDAGVPVDALITAVKDAVKRAGVSRTSDRSDLRVKSVQLILQAITSKTAGGGIDFCIPFIGMTIRAGGKVTKRDTHTIDVTLQPPDQPARQVRGDDVEDALVDAITTIRTVMAQAAMGDDPWSLSAGTVNIAFGVTRTGTISLGADGELANEVTHTLRLSLAPSQ
jgi:hypothetical protein